MQQALADFAVAQTLLSDRVAAPPYHGSVAVDAAMAKLQQSAEKALKAAILGEAPAASSLVFYPHTLLTGASLPESRKFRALLNRISKIRHRPNLRAFLEKLESYARRVFLRRT